MKKPHGYFVISLDFELFWGMTDKYTLPQYGENIRGVQSALPHLLEVFTAHGIHATWATVGMLMAECKDTLKSLLPPPHLRPKYRSERLSAYHHLETGPVGKNEGEDPYHYGPSLVRAIITTPNQELANHTFSHYYALDGDTNGPEVFRADLRAHRAIAETYCVVTESIVFPRNQASDEALHVCHEEDLRAYRGNENHFLYRGRKDSAQSRFVRALRLIDHYINISGHHTYPLPTVKPGYPLNIPASRFFRPYMKALAFFEPLRLRRIKKSMTHAAEHGEVFHLWWHPHNFGTNQTENFKNLEEILTHFEMLKKKYHFESASMKEIADIVSESSAR